MSHLRLIFVVIILLLVESGLPVVAQEATSEATPTLTENYTTDSGTVSLTYPTGWIANKSECTGDTLYLWLANTKSASEGFLSSTDEFNSDDVVVFVNVVKKVRLLSNPFNIKLTRDLDIVSVLHTWRPPLLFDGQNADFSEMTFKGKSAAQVSFSVPNYVDGYALLFELDSETLGLVAVYTYPAKRLQWESTALTIAESLQYIPVTIPTSEPIVGKSLILSETHVSENQHISFRLPTGWMTQSRINDPYRRLGAEVIGIANKGSYAADYYPNDIATGTVNITIAVDHLSELIPMSQTPGDFSFSEITQMLMAISSNALGFTCYHVATQDEMKINNHNAVRIDGVNEKVETMLLIVDYDNSVFGIIKTTAPQGELTQWLPTVLAIAESITYNG